MKKLILIFIMLIILSVSISLAQSNGDACPAIVHAAIESIDEFCADTGRNEACYGHTDLEAVPRPEVTEFIFEQSGDIIEVLDLESMKLSEMDEENEVWGATLMRLQANIPNTLPGENVTVLFFGDTEVTNDVAVDNQDDIPPMQSFIFKSGIGDSRCEEAPDSGFMIQTPDDIGIVNMTINGVDVEVGSTVYVNQQNQFERQEREVCFSTLEGAALLTVGANSSDVQEGTVSCVPIDDETLEANGRPSAPAPILPEVLNQLSLIADEVFGVEVPDTTQQSSNDFAQSRLHTVKPGETVFLIGLCYGVTVGEMQAANDLDDYRLIYVGQQLVIPGTFDFAPANWLCSQTIAAPIASPTPTPSGGGGGQNIILITPGPFQTPTILAPNIVPIAACIVPSVGTYNVTIGPSPAGTITLSIANSSTVSTPGGVVPPLTLTRDTAQESDCSNGVVYVGGGWTWVFNSATTFSGTDGSISINGSI